MLQKYDYFDIHTHNPSIDVDVVSINNVAAPFNAAHSASLYSYGIHPYDVQNAREEWLNVDFKANGLVAIGEIGLDFRFMESVTLQIEWFVKQLKLAKECDLPVVVHCVKAIPQTLDLIKKTDVSRFVFHGFNSSLQNAERVINNGGYLSFGAKLLTSEALQGVFAQVDKSRIFLETDDSAANIKAIYAKACEIIGESIIEVIEENFIKFFRYNYAK